MPTIKRLYLAFIFLLLLPLLILLSSIIEIKYFPVLDVKAVSVSYTLNETGMSRLKFQIQGHKFRSCPLKTIYARWLIDSKIGKDDVLYKETGEVYTFPLNVEGGKDFTTIPLIAKFSGQLPPNSKLILHYVYNCHLIYDSEQDLVINVPELTK